MSTTVYHGVVELDAGLRQPEIRINDALNIFDKIGGPRARVYHNANQSISNNTNTALNFNSERFDTNTCHDNSTNNSRLTCQTAGTYLMIGHCGFAANATGRRLIALRVGGSTYIAIHSTLSVGGSDDTFMSIASMYTLAVNDYVELIGYQNSGGSLNVLASANYSPEFMMIRVGP